MASVLLPWYARFYKEWLKTENLILKYEDLVDDPQNIFESICKTHEISKKPNFREHLSECKREKDLNNFNVGKVGRGKTLPSPVLIHCKKIIKSLNIKEEFPFD